jgi:hypothetical protein
VRKERKEGERKREAAHLSNLTDYFLSKEGTARVLSKKQVVTFILIKHCDYSHLT